MMKKLFSSKIIQKKLALLICIVLILNSTFLPISVHGEETPPPQTTEQPQTPPSETASQPPSDPTPPPETPQPASEIQTGDATSQATTDTTVNYTETTVPGNVSNADCSVDVNLDCNPSQTNEALVEAETSSTSTSGINTITGAAGGAEIQTGTAVSQATGENLINTNIIEATQEAGLETTDTETPADPTTVELTNSADLTAASEAQSTSGQNTIQEAAGDATIDSGTSIAQADQANIVNTNIIGSNFEFFLLPIVDEQNGDINLNELWNQLKQKISEQSADLNGTNIAIINTNSAHLDLSNTALAVSGQNTVSDNAGNATILTGDSIATASIFNLINLNIIGSNFLFGVINIFGTLNGNIVVPNPYRFLEFLVQNNSLSETEIINQNFAKITGKVQALSDSGTNSAVSEGDQTILTGDSFAYASSNNFANLNINLSNWYFLMLNNFGFWNGTVDSWQDPAAKITQEDESTTYEMDNPQAPNQLQAEQTSTDGNTSVLNQNTVEVKADVSATAISGQNKILGGLTSFIKTGRSIALANIFNFLNTNIIAGNFFMPIINLFGNWKGNLVFAYPQMQTEISTDKQEVQYGDTLNYNVNYNNIGYEEARNVTLNISLPAEASLLSVSGPKFSAEGNSLKFFIGNVGAKQGGSFSFSAEIVEPAQISTKPNLLNKLLAKIFPPVMASENGKELVTTASISTPDPQSDTSKNNSAVVTYLIVNKNISYASQQNDSGSQQQDQTDPGLVPQLEVTSWNNTGEYVYPGDVITFFAELKNKGLGQSVNTVIKQNIEIDGTVVAQNQFDLGTIEGGKQKKLTFDLQIPKKAPPGLYRSIIFAEGKSTAGSTYYSNDSVSEFYLESTETAYDTGQILKPGSVLAAELNKKTDSQGQNNPLYFLVFILSILWYVEYVRRRSAEEKLDLLLKKTENKVEKSVPIRNYTWFRRPFFHFRL